MSTNWQMRDAKNRLGELIEKASSEGPQYITKHGKPAAVVLSPHDYDRLTSRQESLVEFFRRSALKGMAFDRE